MPVWTAIVIALISGLGGGLIGTLVKIADDRKVELRHATIDAIQDFAALASEWAELVGKAILRTADENEIPGYGPIEAAERMLHEGRRRLDRLAVLVGPSHELVTLGALTLRWYARAIEVLPPSIVEVKSDLTDEEHFALSERARSGDSEAEEELADAQADAFDREIARARSFHDQGLERWGLFTDAATRELHRGMLSPLRDAFGRLGIVVRVALRRQQGIAPAGGRGQIGH